MPMYLEGIKYVLAFLSGYITIYITFLNKLVNLGQLRAFRITNVVHFVRNFEHNNCIKSMHVQKYER